MGSIENLQEMIRFFKFRAWLAGHHLLKIFVRNDYFERYNLLG